MEIEIIITHARLAKLYKDSGQTEEKNIHLREALAISQSSDNTTFNSLTNEQSLFNKLDEFEYLYPR